MVHHDWPLTLLALHKLVQAIDYLYWERKAEVTCETRDTHPTSKVDPKGDPNAGRNPEAISKGKSPESQKPGLDMTGKLGKDGKLTSQEHQCRLDNSLCLFCGKPDP